MQHVLETSQKILQRWSPLLLLLTGFGIFFSLYRLFSRPSIPVGAPRLVNDNYPIVGATRFFTERWDFFQQAIASSATGHFSFHLGKNVVVGVSGEEGRRFFFDTKALGFSEGYEVLFGQGPDASYAGGDFPRWFNNRLTTMLKKDVLSRTLSQLIIDARSGVQNIASSSVKIIDPFDEVYTLVFNLNMRTVGCADIADDPILLKKALRLYEDIENSSTGTSIIFPWFPTPAKLKRMVSGAKLYMMFQRIATTRQKKQKRVDDPLQFMLDQGDDIGKIIAFVIGALFAAQLNSGINACWLLGFFAKNTEWRRRAREEIRSVANKYKKDPDAPLYDQLSTIPVEAWESEFPILDVCLKDSIRLTQIGNAFRRNISGRPLPLGPGKEGGEIIPDGAFAVYHFGGTHQNPAIFPDPETWDPARYLPERAEDKKVQHAFVGWGSGRHLCLGMRFAKLELNVILAHFLSRFDFSVCDPKGRAAELPKMDLNGHAAAKPHPTFYLKLAEREV